MRRLSIVMLIAALGCPGGTGCKKRPPVDDDPGFGGPKVTRPMKKAGTWYAADPQQLGAELDRNLIGAKLPDTKGRLVALISPHAGYQFSGPTAAYGFKLLGQQRGVERVVTIGLSHRYPLRGVSLQKITHYQTPFGLLRVDTKTRDRLLGQRPFSTVDPAHGSEHSVELQMPYIKRVRPRVTVVPMLVGTMSSDERKAAAKALAPLLDGHTVFLASSDFTHRGRGFGYEVPKNEGESLRQATRRMDFSLLPFIRALDDDGLMAYYGRTKVTVCGRAPIALLLATLRQAGVRVSTQVLHYTTSGEVTNDWRSSVSYLSVAMMTTK